MHFPPPPWRAVRRACGAPAALLLALGWLLQAPCGAQTDLSTWFALQSGTPHDLEDITFVGTCVPRTQPHACAAAPPYAIGMSTTACEPPASTVEVAVVPVRDTFTLA
jgi:hypothetical protein